MQNQKWKQNKIKIYTLFVIFVFKKIYKGSTHEREAKKMRSDLYSKGFIFLKLRSPFLVNPR